MEPQWTKQIPNWAVCGWYYVFFVVNATVFALVTLMMLWALFKAPSAVRGFKVFIAATSMAVSLTTSLFFYLMCDRSLKPKA